MRINVARQQVLYIDIINRVDTHKELVAMKIATFQKDMGGHWSKSHFLFMRSLKLFKNNFPDNTGDHSIVILNFILSLSKIVIFSISKFYWAKSRGMLYVVL